MTRNIIQKSLTNNTMQGAIRVYECEKRERANGKGDYFFVTGKMGGLSSNFISEIALPPGDNKVNVTLSEYGGKLTMRIESLVKA